MLRPGEVVDRYVVEEILGEGAMSTVYRVRHVELGTVHALKLLTLTRRAEWRARLLQEGRLQAGLDHPNIVRVTDVVRVNDMPALLMDHVAGGTLQEWLHRNQPDLPELERLFRAILDGVEHAHALGLVHRDLKPGNILLELGEDGPVPQVADFGLAKLWRDGAADGHTLAGTPMGTPQYMAPEQIRDAKHVDHRADIFALGCILYELTCGVRPFDAPEVSAIFKAIAEGAYAPPERFKPDLPARIRDTIVGCLKVDPQLRFGSCAEIREALAGRSTLRSQTPTLPRATPTLSPATMPPLPSNVPTLPLPTFDTSVRGGRWMPWLAMLLLLGTWGPLASALSRWSPESDSQTAVVEVASAPTGWGVAPDASDSAAVPEGDALAFAEEPASPREPRDEAGGLCGGRPGHVVGYARAPGIFLLRAGAVWSPDRDRLVFATPPGERDDAPGPVVCRIPEGARVELWQDPVKVAGEGHWVPIVAGGVRAD